MGEKEKELNQLHSLLIDAGTALRSKDTKRLKTPYLLCGAGMRQQRMGWLDGMVGWHHRLNGHKFEQSPGVGDGQESLACCGPRGHKERDVTG